MNEVNLWEIEDSLYSDEIVTICGVDEAGRGPLAGPVCLRNRHKGSFIIKFNSEIILYSLSCNMFILQQVR